MFNTREYDLVDVQIAFCKVFGMSHPETAKAISTPDHPAGISEKTVASRIQKKKQFIDELVRWGAALKRERQLEVKEVTKETLRAEMEKELGTSWAAIVAAVKDGDTDTARWHVEQVVGKASQVHKHEGDVNVNHTLIWQGRAELEQQERDMIDSERLLAAAPANVLEAEIVEH